MASDGSITIVACGSYGRRRKPTEPSASSTYAPSTRFLTACARVPLCEVFGRARQLRPFPLASPPCGNLKPQRPSFPLRVRLPFTVLSVRTFRAFHVERDFGPPVP